jgi:hypothetical protein
MSDDDYVPVVDAARSPLLAEIGRLRSELYNVHAHLQHMREETARLRAALKEITQVYVGAPGWASPEGDPQGLAWKMSDIARRALEERQ